MQAFSGQNDFVACICQSVSRNTIEDLSARPDRKNLEESGPRVTFNVPPGLSIPVASLITTLLYFLLMLKLNEGP
jgi:hypothetical protein